MSYQPGDFEDPDEPEDNGCMGIMIGLFFGAVFWVIFFLWLLL